MTVTCHNAGVTVKDIIREMTQVHCTVDIYSQNTVYPSKSHQDLNLDRISTDHPKNKRYQPFPSPQDPQILYKFIAKGHPNTV